MKYIIIQFLFSLALLTDLPSDEIRGKWISEKPEKTPSGTYSIREFSIEKKKWEVRYTLYQDSALKLPVFTFRGKGTIQVGRPSATVDNTYEAVFQFERKYLSIKTRDTSLVNKFGMGDCRLQYMKEKDITESGCSYFLSQMKCGQEYDLVSLKNGLLYLGERPKSGGMCEIDKRPRRLGPPLKRKLP
jgi:hypothetical protein